MLVKKLMERMNCALHSGNELDVRARNEASLPSFVANPITKIMPYVLATPADPDLESGDFR
jgi:hypothetical protein